MSWVALIVTSGAAAQEVGKDVKPDHWAYAAIQDLAKKGLIKGYPPDAHFLGNRAMVDALLSRLRHYCHTVRIQGPSLRDPQG